MTLPKFISAVCLILALGVYSFARCPISKSPQTGEKAEKEFKRALKSYEEIRDKFNRTLAGKFPFSALPQAEPFEEADPEDIDAFFKLMETNQATAEAALKQAPDYGISPIDATDALHFLDELKQVQGFFASFLGKKPLYPSYELSLTFRVNCDREIGANQIIDWAFTVGTKRIGYQDKDKTAIWGYRDPLVLSLRWANDSPFIPFLTPTSHMSINGKTVTLAYNNNWSLLLFILNHRGTASDFKDGVDIEPYTLKIIVPNRPDANNLPERQPVELRPEAAYVFLRIGLLAPGKKDPLILPDVFPTRAPQLLTPLQSFNRSEENRSN